MHGAHDRSRTVPGAISDGGTAILPLLGLRQPVPIYYLPCAEQRGLLFQPLLFHEFGHLLYQLHREEMDDLIWDLQRRITEGLQPAARRNDRHAEGQRVQRRQIVETWYPWAQELFCDAVGLAIGGPAFLLALSKHLSVVDASSFYRRVPDLAMSSHPVTWLRVNLLSERARELGYGAAAADVEREWAVAAGALGVTEDYHGYYDRSFAAFVRRTVDDMLTEAGPRPCLPEEADGGGWGPAGGSMPGLFNAAWQRYLQDKDDYWAWEQSTIHQFLGQP